MKMSIVLNLFRVQCCFSCCSLMWQQHGRHGHKQTSWSERPGLYLARVWTHSETLHLKLQAILDNTKHPLHNILAGTNCWLQKQPISAGLSSSRCPLSPLPSGSIPPQPKAVAHVMDYWTIIFLSYIISVTSLKLLDNWISRRNEWSLFVCLSKVLDENPEHHQSYRDSSWDWRECLPQISLQSIQ